MFSLRFSTARRLCVGIAVMVGAVCVYAQPVPPQNPIMVGAGCSLVDAFNVANSNDVGTTGCARGTVSLTNYTIVIPAGTSTVLVSGSTLDPGSALPVANNVAITIEGNGNLVQRSPAAPDFRIFFVGAGGSLTLNNLRVQGGRAAGSFGGGAIATLQGTVILNNSTLSSNSAGFSLAGGGAISSIAGVVRVNNSTISGNAVEGNGGGIFFQTPISGVNLQISNSTISGNTATLQGGGIYISSGEASVNNSTFTGNSAIEGGGLFISSSVQASVTNSVISGNTAVAVSGNTLGMSTELTCASGLTPFNNNVLGHAGLTQTEAACQFLFANPSNTVATSDQANITLARILDTVLRDNGGPTFTHALVANSPAINPTRSTTDTSNPTATDQRGFSPNAAAQVPDTVRDIGAFEFNGVDPNQPPTPGQPGISGNPTAIPTLAEYTLLLLAGLMLVIAMVQIRQKRGPG